MKMRPIYKSLIRKKCMRRNSGVIKEIKAKIKDSR